MGDYHDLYVQTDTLLLADVFEKSREKCIEIMMKIMMKDIFLKWI